MRFSNKPDLFEKKMQTKMISDLRNDLYKAVKGPSTRP